MSDGCKFPDVKLGSGRSPGSSANYETSRIPHVPCESSAPGHSLHGQSRLMDRPERKVPADDRLTEVVFGARAFWVKDRRLMRAAAEPVSLLRLSVRNHHRRRRRRWRRRRRSQCSARTPCASCPTSSPSSVRGPAHKQVSLADHGHSAGVSTCAFCLARRTAGEDFFSSRGRANITHAKWCLLLVFVDSCVSRVYSVNLHTYLAHNFPAGSSWRSVRHARPRELTSY